MYRLTFFDTVTYESHKRIVGTFSRQLMWYFWRFCDKNLNIFHFVSVWVWKELLKTWILEKILYLINCNLWSDWPITCLSSMHKIHKSVATSPQVMTQIEQDVQPLKLITPTVFYIISELSLFRFWAGSQSDCLKISKLQMCDIFLLC